MRLEGPSRGLHPIPVLKPQPTSKLGCSSCIQLSFEQLQGWRSSTPLACPRSVPLPQGRGSHVVLSLSSRCTCPGGVCLHLLYTLQLVAVGTPSCSHLEAERARLPQLVFIHHILWSTMIRDLCWARFIGCQIYQHLCDLLTQQGDLAKYHSYHLGCQVLKCVLSSSGTK